MSDIARRLRASVAFDAMNGDSMDRAVCSRQMMEAAAEIERLRAIVAEVKAAVHGFETGDAENIIDRVRRAVHEEAQP